MSVRTTERLPGKGPGCHHRVRELKPSLRQWDNAADEEFSHAGRTGDPAEAGDLGWQALGAAGSARPAGIGAARNGDDLDEDLVVRKGYSILDQDCADDSTHAVAIFSGSFRKSAEHEVRR